MPPYDTIVWGESAAKTGLTGVTSKGPTGIGYVIAGDEITLKSKDRPYLLGMGVTGTSKPGGGRIVPSKSPTSYYCGGAVRFFPEGWTDYYKHSIAPLLYKSDVLTGQADSTAVNEDTILAANISYGAPLPKPNLGRFIGAEHYKELMTVTAAGAITYGSGTVTITTALTNVTNWLKLDANYYLLGISGNIGVADGAGILHFTNLPGVWDKYAPGIQVNGLDAVVFSTGQGEFTPFPEPIGPITGEQLDDNVEVSAFLSGAVASTTTLHFCKVGR